ncbi:hypothetical protein B0H14DRAFT_3498690 [Mycena olivaceomarginata]|nr:hypothetical protein B0H14DRAFT_3498690 [Mycena olivaceomarginata]
MVAPNGRSRPACPAPTRRSRRQCPRTHWLDAHAAYQHMQNWFAPTSPRCAPALPVCAQGHSPLRLPVSPGGFHEPPRACYARYHEHRGRPPSLGSPMDSMSHPVLATQDTTSTADDRQSLGSPVDSTSHPVLAMQDTMSTADDRRRSGALWIPHLPGPVPTRCSR